MTEETDELYRLGYLIDRYRPHFDTQSEMALIRSIHNWDIYYLGMAKHAASKSKDPSTKTGAVIVRDDWSVCSVGFNGFPKGMPDKPEWYANREEKYSRIVHCEVNAQILSRDDSMKGYTLYTWPFSSCDRCCVTLLQAGIVRFVAPALPDDLKSRWEASLNKTRQYIKDCGRILDVVQF